MISGQIHENDSGEECIKANGREYLVLDGSSISLTTCPQAIEEFVKELSKN